MEAISNVASGFIGLFQAGGETFMGWVTGIIPLVVCLMTAVNAIIKLLGTEKVENFAQKITKYMILLQDFSHMQTLVSFLYGQVFRQVLLRLVMQLLVLQ